MSIVHAATTALCKFTASVFVFWLYCSFTDDEDDFGSRSGWIKDLVLLYELRRLRQVRVALDGELADGREAVVSSVGKIGTVGQHW